MPPAMETSSCNGFQGLGARVVPRDNEDDAFLAKELNALTMEEREKVYEEVHGVNSVQEETPEFIQERVAEVKMELSKFSVTKRRAFDRAIFLKPGLENDVNLYLLFLRSTNYDGNTAAHKLCLHFDHKLELFGEAKLPKKITLDDLDEDDKAVFQTGCQIILPQKDRSGRTIQIINIPRMSFKHWKNQVRYTWYNVFNALLNDDECGKKGTVDVMYFVDMKHVPANLLNYVRDAHHILTAMPAIPRGFHVCYNNEILRTFLSFLHMFTSKERRLRERIHFGSHLEVQYEMLSYGIDVGDVFSIENERVSSKFIRNFLKKRIEIEAMEKEDEKRREQETGRIGHPSPIDVLCGRGRPYQDFAGNLRVGRIVDEQVSRYIETNERVAKTMIAMDIVRKVQNDGGRFLCRKDDGWEITNDKVARGKISQALRVRALKKIRGEGCEPSPIKTISDPIPATVTTRDAKRLKMSVAAVSDEEEFQLIDFTPLEDVVV